MKQAPCIYLDIQTQRTSIDVGSWKPEKMGLAIAVVLSGHRLRIFTEKDISRLAETLRSAQCVVGYNLLGFDLKVLAGYEGINLQEIHCLDLMHDIQLATGLRLGLSSLMQATLGHAPDHDALALTEHYKKGEIEAVIEGCCNNVLAIRALHEHGQANAQVFYCAKKNMRRKSIKVGWSLCDFSDEYVPRSDENRPRLLSQAIIS